MFEKLKSYKAKKGQITLYDAKEFGNDLTALTFKSRLTVSCPENENLDLIFMVLDEYIQDCGPGDLYFYKIMFNSSFYMICLGPNEVEDFGDWFEAIEMDEKS